MGQAKNRGTYEERVKQAKQSYCFQHSGIDLYFKNISDSDLKHFAGILNDLNRTMSGHKLVWQSNPGSNAVTCHYPTQRFNMNQLLQGLDQNRIWGESLVKKYNEHQGTDIKYNGSEFYIEPFGNKDEMNQIFTQEIDKIKEEA